MKKFRIQIFAYKMYGDFIIESFGASDPRGIFGVEGA